MGKVLKISKWNYITIDYKKWKILFSKTYIRTQKFWMVLLSVLLDSYLHWFKSRQSAFNKVFEGLQLYQKWNPQHVVLTGFMENFRTSNSNISCGWLLLTNKMIQNQEIWAHDHQLIGIMQSLFPNQQEWSKLDIN